ncbi:ribbon-helix-helix protein, CopG family [Fusobacterium polymorphum]|uniref:ribbon-helix-helix protein, CopG family n=1 Tax=Fusobacterium nucleatum subsp. polymorphum TaxID=76857 RepID=UPI00300A1AE3
MDKDEEKELEFLEEIEVVKKKRVEFQLEENLLKLVDAKADLKGISRSEFLRNLILKDINNITSNITPKEIKRIRKLTIEDRKMRIAFNKLGVVLNQGIKLFLANKREKLEGLEDEVLDLLEKNKSELEEYKKYLL